MALPEPKLVSRIRLKRKWTPTQWLRLGSQLLFFLLTAAAIFQHRLNAEAGLDGPANTAPSADSLSPMGGLETLWAYIQTGSTLQHLHLSDLVLLTASVVLVFLLGPAFCGWICPFGAINEWLYRLRTRFLPWKITIPARVDQVLRYGRFLVLGLILYFTYSLAAFVFGDYCPWRTIWELGSDEMAITGVVVLAIVVIGGLLVERFWCRYACPLGGFLGIFNKLTPVRLKRTPAECTACNRCNRKCPLDIDVLAVETVSDTSCMRCLECVDTCPRPDALGVKAGFGARLCPIPGWLYGTLAVAIFGGVILAGMATGYWQSTASTAAPQPNAATGLIDTTEIKGWRTLKEVLDLYGIPQELLYRELELDPTANPPATTKLKDLEGKTKADGTVLDTTYVRDLVARWQKGEVK